MKLLDLYSVEREEESKRFNPDNLDNVKLLWHGSRFSNYGGILSQGLRVAPKEAPSTGYLFGKGIYFADMAGKSATYCYADTSNNTGLLLLCEVALGEPKLLNSSEEFKKKMIEESDSIQCVG